MGRGGGGDGGGGGASGLGKKQSAEAKPRTRNLLQDRAHNRDWAQPFELIERGGGDLTGSRPLSLNSGVCVCASAIKLKQKLPQ